MAKQYGIQGVGLAVMAIAPSLVFSIAAYATPVLEAEANPPENNTLETTQNLDSEVTHIIGELGLLADPADYDYRATQVLAGDRADTVTFADLPPGEPFFAWIDNSASGIDTVLGIFSETGMVLNVDDDGSPAGTGVASGVGGQVNADGTIVLGVSGFPDFNFDGQYSPDEAAVVSESSSVSAGPAGGNYTLYIQTGTSDMNAIDPAQADYSFSARIATGGVDEFVLQDIPPSTPFVAWIDNRESNIDTVMGLFSEAGELLRFDDDGSPVGTGAASAIASSAGADGTLRLRVALFPDLNFNGQYTDDAVPLVDDQGNTSLPLTPSPHGFAGEYDVFVTLGIDRIAGDIDFYTISDLEPGQEFIAEVRLANFDSRLGWFDEAGALLQGNDDGGEGPLSRITGTIPGNGTLTLAVTGAEDVDFTGTHTVSGDYLLRLTTPHR